MINPVSNISYVPFVIPNKKSGRFYYSSPCDCVSFTSANLLKLSTEQISTKVLDAVADRAANLIGGGREGIVYRIPGSEYCVKLVKRNPFTMKDFGEWHLTSDKKDAVNHILARAENGATIMKYIEGTPLSCYTNLEEMANLPKESYVKLLKQVSAAEDMKMFFDCAPANVLYDSGNKTLTAIDFYTPSVDFVMYPFTKVFSALESPHTSFQNIQNNKKLAGRLLDIALDGYEGAVEPEYKLIDDDIIRFLHKFKGAYSSMLPPQFDFLKKSFLELFDLKKAERRGDDVGNLIAGKIKYARCIVKQILIGDKP